MTAWGFYYGAFMIAYEFYWHDPMGEVHLIGVLPERRSNRNRITHESIINWGIKLLGDTLGIGKISFTQIIVDETTGRILSRPTFA